MSRGGRGSWWVYATVAVVAAVVVIALMVALDAGWLGDVISPREPLERGG